MPVINFGRWYDKVARPCAAEGVDHTCHPLRLTGLELIDRERRMVERRIKGARFPTTRSLDSLDFKAMPSLDKMMVIQLARCDFIGRQETIIAVGNSGTAKTQAMQLHLDEIGRHAAAKAHGVVLMDRAGWHGTDKLKVPRNITIILLPSRSPELNPVENIWQYLRGNWLSNRVFEDHEAILDAGYEAWNKLVAQPQTITSIAMRDWAHTGH